MVRSSVSNFAIYRARCLTHARQRWRAAAHLVAMRWDNVLGAEAETRPFAFAACVESPDAEEAAAARVAGLLSRNARYETSG